MSYPKDIEDYTTEELVREIGRRVHNFRFGLCPYCRKKLRRNAAYDVVCDCKFGSSLLDYHRPSTMKELLAGSE